MISESYESACKHNNLKLFCLIMVLLCSHPQIGHAYNGVDIKLCNYGSIDLYIARAVIFSWPNSNTNEDRLDGWFHFAPGKCSSIDYRGLTANYFFDFAAELKNGDKAYIYISNASFPSDTDRSKAVFWVAPRNKKFEATMEQIDPKRTNADSRKVPSNFSIVLSARDNANYEIILKPKKSDKIQPYISGDGTANQSVAETEDDTSLWDIGLVALGIGAVVCAVDPELCALNNDNSNENITSNPVSGNSYKFKVKNNCPHKINLALNYQEGTIEAWKAMGWWTIERNYETYLVLQQDAYVTTKNSTFYYYVEASDGSFFSDGGDYNVKVGDRTVPMLKGEDPEAETQGEIQFNFVCTGF